MILTRTPLRVSIGGGGTDLPSYYRRNGGSVISAAIDKYVYLAINPTFTDDYLLKYSVHERVGRVDDIEHALIREVLRAYEVQPGIEIVSVADIPAGTGLGSSGSFTVGLLRALHAHMRRHCSIADLAEEACHIEIERLGNPSGKQDQYIAAFGGLTRFEFRPDDSVAIERLDAQKDTLADLEDHMLLFFTGYSREASTILADQKHRSERDDAEMIANLDYVNDLGQQIGSALESGDTILFAELMHEHWTYKRQRSQGITNLQIDAWYDLAEQRRDRREARGRGCRRVSPVLRRGSAPATRGDDRRGPSRGAVRFRLRRFRRIGPELTVAAVRRVGRR